jgi:hypothetical protein
LSLCSGDIEDESDSSEKRPCKKENGSSKER